VHSSFIPKQLCSVQARRRGPGAPHGHLLASILLFLTMSTPSLAQNPLKSGAPGQPPVAEKHHTERSLTGGILTDDYAWLRERDNPKVIAYLEAENAYTAAVMAPTKPLQEKLNTEMLSHLKQTDDSVPFRRGEFFYYYRTEEGKQYPILCRRHGSVANPEQVILDVNQLAAGEKFMALGDTAVSDDGKLLAFTTDNVGFRQYTLHVKNLNTGDFYPEHAPRVGSLAWAADNKTLFYTQEDEVEKRQYRLYRHTLGTDAATDPIVYEEKDERFNVGIERTGSRSYLLLEIGSHTTTEVRYLPADQPESINWITILPRKDDIEYYVGERHGEFFLRINDTARTFRLVTAPIALAGDKAHWKEIIAARPDIALDGVDVFEDFYVAEERVVGLPTLRVVAFADGVSHSISFPDPAYTTAPQNNFEFKTTKLRYYYQSLVTPSSIYDYDVAAHSSTLLKRTEIPGGYDPSLYKSERIFATASDGTRIPISVVYRKDLKRGDGSNPLYVYGYGSYGYSLPIGFSGNRLSLLDRGVVMAYAHIRGGGELGQPWHDAGRMMNKRNTFTDFITSVEFLTANHYGAKEKVAIEGGSAGGLLMGAVTNMRPDLFRVVLSHVPFVDVMNTMLDPTLPLTVPEYEEWGNPNEAAAFKYMLTYSPYDNLHRAAYPAILVKTSFHDSQVMYWEPAKYVAKLRTLNTDHNPLLLETNMNAGHGGASGRYDYLKEIAFDYAFLLTQLGVERP
jgi:oligopeptidase B